MGHEQWEDDPHVGEIGHVGDEDLRSEFARAFPISYESSEAFKALRPDLTRARRGYLAKQFAGGMVGVGLAIAVGAFALSQVGPAAPDLDIVTGPAEQADSSTATSRDDHASLPPGLPVTSTPTAAASDAESADTTGDEGGAIPTGEGDTPVTGSDGATVTESITTTTPTSTEPTSTDPSTAPTTPSSSPGPSPTSLLESACGTLSYRVHGRDLELVEVISAIGGEPDIKSAGPEEIEVSIENDGQHCELKVEWEDGRLVAKSEDGSG